MDITSQTREVVDLQALDLFLDRLIIREQRRHGDERAQLRRNAIAKLQSGQKRSTEAPCHAAIYQRDRSIDGGDRTQNAEQTQPCPANPRCGQGRQRQREKSSGDGGYGAPVATNAECLDHASEPSMQWRLEAGRCFERTAPPGEEVIARITPAIVFHARVPGRISLRGQNGATRDVEFRAAATRAPAPRWRCGKGCALENPYLESRRRLQALDRRG